MTKSKSKSSRDANNRKSRLMSRQYSSYIVFTRSSKSCPLFAFHIKLYVSLGLWPRWINLFIVGLLIWFSNFFIRIRSEESSPPKWGERGILGGGCAGWGKHGTAANIVATLRPLLVRCTLTPLFVQSLISPKIPTQFFTCITKFLLHCFSSPIFRLLLLFNFLNKKIWKEGGWVG